MPVIKPPFDGSEATSDRYDGPPPTPGPYNGVVKGVWLNKIKKGDNAGADQLTVSVEISHGKFKKARILHNLQVLNSTAWSLNQFLDSVTDGSDKQKTTLRQWFWRNGYDVAPDDEAVKNLGVPVRKIVGGKKGFVLLDRKVSFVTKMDTYEGVAKAIVDRFVVPLEDSGSEEPAAEASEDALGEFDAATTHNPEPEPEAAVEETPTEDEPDDDDPWS